MAERLGEVLYWLSLIVTALIFVACAITAYNTRDGGFIFLVFGFVVALVLAAIGRACLYILAGR